MTVTPEPVPSVAMPPLREYRCKKCKKVLVEARAVVELLKLCPKCGKMNTFDDSEVLFKVLRS